MVLYVVWNVYNTLGQRIWINNWDKIKDIYD